MKTKQYTTPTTSVYQMSVMRTLLASGGGAKFGIQTVGAGGIPNVPLQFKGGASVSDGV